MSALLRLNSLFLEMSKNVEAMKTFAQGALGAMSFGAYHQYTTNKLMELNNENQDFKYKLFMEQMDRRHQNEITELRSHIETLKKQQWF
jgi:hypothetical protein